jgi:hypothetical protein
LHFTVEKGFFPEEPPSFFHFILLLGLIVSERGGERKEI